MENNEQQSLYEFIRTAAAPLRETGVLPEFSLPPDPNAALPFADGAQDGITMYHTGGDDISDETKSLMAKAVQTAAKGEYKAAEQLFIELGKSARAISLIDELQEYIIANRETLPAGELCKFAVYAAEMSSDRECVKFGLSILELLNIEDNEPVKSMVTVLGLSSEFTLFSVFVMLRWHDGNEAIAFLARSVRGWGRIHAIERLEPETEEIRKWLLREGVHNTVVPAYSALTCWNKSGAAELLRSDDELSDEDFHGIRDIIDALLDEGPREGISAIENAEEILAGFLRKASAKSLDIDDYETIRNIRDHAEENGKLTDMCNELLLSEKCRERVKAAVKEGKSIDLANELGIDCRDDILKLLESSVEDNAHLCHYLLNDGEYRAKAIEIFRNALPLDEMKTEPLDVLGFGPEFKRQNCLDFIVQELGNYPLEGLELVETALQCAPPRNRNFALRALQGWVDIKQTPLERLLPETFALVCRLKENEPTDSVRERMEKLINGEIGTNE